MYRAENVCSLCLIARGSCTGSVYAVHRCVSEDKHEFLVQKDFVTQLILCQLRFHKNFLFNSFPFSFPAIRYATANADTSFYTPRACNLGFCETYWSLILSWRLEWNKPEHLAPPISMSDNQSSLNSIDFCFINILVSWCLDKLPSQMIRVILMALFLNESQLPSLLLLQCRLHANYVISLWIEILTATLPRQRAARFLF